METQQADPVVPTWNFAALPWEGPATGAGPGATGKRGDDGTNGKSHWDSGQTKNICDQQPTDGKDGKPGETPDPPKPAADGRPGGVVTQNIGVCKGPITIWYGAGDGQKGGKGGTGGAGGPGDREEAHVSEEELGVTAPRDPVSES